MYNWGILSYHVRLLRMERCKYHFASYYTASTILHHTTLQLQWPDPVTRQIAAKKVFFRRSQSDYIYWLWCGQYVCMQSCHLQQWLKFHDDNRVLSMHDNQTGGIELDRPFLWSVHSCPSQPTEQKAWSEQLVTLPKRGPIVSCNEIV